MFSTKTSGLKAPLFPDIHSHHKHRTTPTSKFRSIPLWMRETPNLPAGEKSREIPTEQEIAQFRKPLHHNVCVAMLRDGFHRSFAELFALLQRWNEADEYPEKLQTVQLHLTRAETAERAGQYGEAYENHLFLARFFKEPQDKWMKHHFFQLALYSARKFMLDSGKKEAEASLHMGQVYLEKGELELAQQHLEVFYQLTVGHSWEDSSGRMQHLCSCEELQTVYTLMAQRSLQDQDYKHAINLLNKAYEMAKETGDQGLEGEAAYRLGQGYQSMGDQKTAKQFFSKFMEIAITLQNTDCLGRAHEAIGKSLESEGKLTEAIEHLEKFAEVSLNSKLDKNLERAYMSLGNIFRSQKQYDAASMYFERAYELACDQACPRRLEKAQVCVGSVRALGMIKKYSRLVQTAGQQNIQALISWKESREDTFKSWKSTG